MNAPGAVHDSGRVRLLGVSNVTLEQLQRLCEQARVPPRFVQNRCYAMQGWDRHVRRFCVRHDAEDDGRFHQDGAGLDAADTALVRIAHAGFRHATETAFRLAIERAAMRSNG